MKAAALLIAALPTLATVASAAPIALGFSDDGCYVISADGPDSLSIFSGSFLAGPLDGNHGQYQFGGLSRITTEPLAGGIFPITSPSAQPLSIDLAGNHLDGTVLWSQLDDARWTLSGTLTINHNIGFGDFVPGGTSEIDLSLMFEGDPSQSFDRMLAKQESLARVLVSYGTIQPNQSPVSTPEPWSIMLLGTFLAGAALFRLSI